MRKARKITPDVYVHEVGLSEFAPRLCSSTAAIVGPAIGGPKPIFLGPSIPKPRWWQPWRWHQIPRYRRECREAYARFCKLFGPPRDPADARSAPAA